MKRYTHEELETVKALHKLWVESRGEDGECADLTGANLRGADFTGADFRGADFTGADFRGANLRGADFTGADFRGADFTGADFRGADFRGADFTGANLRGADFTGDLKIQKATVFTGLYTYFAMPIIAEDGTEWVRLGCYMRKVTDWEADFWNNTREFPNDGSAKSRERELAYRTCLAWLEIHRPERGDSAKEKE